MNKLKRIITIIGICVICAPLLQCAGANTSLDYYFDSGATVVRHSEVYNLANAESFFGSIPVENSEIRVVVYTIEGDPIIYDITYRAQTYEVKTDTSRDRYGGRLRSSTDYYQNVEIVQGDGYTEYYLSMDSPAAENQKLQLLSVRNK